jgi:hypothetical protein
MRTLLLICLLVLPMLCVGQVTKPETQNSFRREPLIVFKVDDQTVVLDQDKGEVIELSSLKPEWIKVVEVLKDEKATEAYGEKGKYGVIIVTLNDYHVLPTAIQNKFIKED